MATWLQGTEGHGAGNVWAEMSVDDSLDLVYLPTTSPSVDFWGGSRPGNNQYADSIVAVKGSTGEVVWSFQFTHHNLWDYDTPTQPLLVDLPYNGKIVPALVQINKTGLIFVFNRKTGEPLLPYVERPVPQEGGVRDEWLSPTQPFPVGMPTLAPQGVTPDDAWGFTPIDRYLCRKRMESLQYGPIYTPPSLKGTILQPSAGGGPDWGGGAYDPASHLMVVPSNRVPMIVKLIPRETCEDRSKPGHRCAWPDAVRECWRAVRHEHRAAAVAAGRAVHGAALGNADRSGSRERRSTMGGASGQHRKAGPPAIFLGIGHAERRRSAGHGGRAGLHRLYTGQQATRIRSADGEDAVEDRYSCACRLRPRKL